MYAQHFGLREEPFRLTPDWRFLHLAETHREVYVHMIQSVIARRGFAVVTGPVGTGKTTLIHAALHIMTTELFPNGNLLSAFLVNPALSREEFLEALIDEFEISCPYPSKPKRLAALQQAFLNVQSRGGTALLIIDEAHLMSHDLLEEVRLLTNVDTYGEKLLQVMLCGQPELLPMLDSPQMAALRQRIAVRCALRPLSAAETRSYIVERLHRAGLSASEALFEPEAYEMVYRYSSGVPRVVNLLCDTAMWLAFQNKSRRLSGEIIQHAASDIGMANETIPEVRRGNGAASTAAGQ